MAENQNPVFTDNETIAGDGTEANPLAVAESGGITEITSDDGSVTVDNPTGPIVDLSVSPSAVREAIAARSAGPVVISGSGSFQDVIESGGVNVPDGSSGQVLVLVSFVLTPQTGNTQLLWKCVKSSDSSQIGLTGGETVAIADGSSFTSRMWMAWESADEWTSGDAVKFQMSAQAGSCDVSGITIAVFLIPSGF